MTPLMMARAEAPMPHILRMCRRDWRSVNEVAEVLGGGRTRSFERALGLLKVDGKVEVRLLRRAGREYEVRRVTGAAPSPPPQGQG